MALLELDLELARDSYYAATAPRQERHAALEGSADTDVAVVGAGLAGLSAALELAGRGFKVTVLEARHVGWGASGRNGGQVIHGLACDQSVIERQLGLADSRRIWDLTIEAMDLIRARCREHDIACEWRDGFLGVAVSPRKARALRAWAEHIGSTYGYPLAWIDRPDLPRWIDSPRYHGAIHDPRSGHLHPLKYCQGLARAAVRRGVRLHEDTPVLGLLPGNPARLTTARGQVAARHVLLAGNVHLDGLAPSLDARIMPVGTYIVATEPVDAARLDRLMPTRSAVCDTNVVLDYFRPTDDHRLLYGGRVSYSTATPRQLVSLMRRRMVGTFPSLADVNIQHAWGGFVDITLNRAPDFGRLEGKASNIYYLQGFSGHGVALAGLAGLLVAQAMAGDTSRFDLFARIRHRPFPGGKWLRRPALVLGMLYYRLRDLL